ncbi:enoyl-CoA hydratase/isomerase family protein [Ensifer adhaerens]|uniref:enoyl-CoA hydratase-related protein n=1 Tax=Ensifer adhaerens TaxID=106592 RepID=UPI001CC0C431|nr:enoyl-CoA hydratase-related protein [Ensifer adhaerens]MBZ7924924.1 enoyl-CoA hydratase/isomerase family protein [Ensifer adhaerens]UAX95865.1 enoyl-CoA hydratase/isomerase family protein [Ensifer adhaerens]UAY04793.1 enoyl-CoA hydratase/isomerase family protein [Ensifer adhaerens]UAY10224.1 enoyl-CoA hydratase/isomerase family protein [Ensifer adhaerens]
MNAEANSVVRVTQSGHVGHITLNRPEKRNALSREMLERLVATLRAFDGDPDIRSVVISGDARAFAAGADIGTLAEAGPVELYGSGFSELWDEVATISKPLVAAVSGYALGGGLELVLICDIVVCDESAVFGMPEAAIGTVPGAGGTQRLVRVVGKTLAMEMILAGRRLNASEALARGLVSTVTAAGQVEAQALAIADKIATNGPVAVKLAKQAVLQSYETPLTAGVRFERSLSALLAASEDRAEGMRAFGEKRKPVFTGR